MSANRKSINFETIFDLICWKDKHRAKPHLGKIERLELKFPPFVRYLDFSEQEFSLALKYLGNLREHPGSRSKRELWLYTEDGVQHLAVTRETVE